MKRLKRQMKMTAAVTALMVSLSLASCNQDTTWTYRTEDGAYEVTSGMYVGMSISAYNSGYSQTDVDTSQPLYDQQIGSVDALTWVQQEVDNLAKKYLAVETKFEEYGLSFTEEEQSYIDSYIEYYWNYLGSSYEDEGCGQESYTKLMTNSFKESQLFYHIYGEGGEREVTEEELRDLFNQQYAHVNIFDVDCSDDEGNPLEGHELEIVEERVANLIERLDNGEDFETVKADYEAEVEAEQAAEEESASSDTSSDETSSEETSASESSASSEESAASEESSAVSEDTSSSASSETSEVSEDASSAESSSASEETASSETSAESSSSDTSSDTETDTDTSVYINTDTTSYPEELVTLLMDASAGEYGSWNDEDGTIYVWVRLENDDTGFETYRDTILQNEKWEEYTQLEQDWINGMTFVQNDAAIRKHNPKNLE
ncbi:MAG TPA: hypothetical protein IAB37_02335 [Candidatus Faecivivens stercoravium]|uniref:Uncharacterized protein n=1 Tax=Candidatus Faecivivens stercoravium TaxID=2840803 RepID=A0A9D1J4H6_9FIRM|nr:hypothetical protein [Candidatus Faecivivens stercoravium]